MSHLYRGRGTGRDIPLSTSAHLIWVVNAPDDWPCTSHHLVDEADNPYLLLSIPPVQSIGWFPESLKAIPPYGHISSMHPPLYIIPYFPPLFPSIIGREGLQPPKSSSLHPLAFLVWGISIIEDIWVVVIPMESIIVPQPRGRERKHPHRSKQLIDVESHTGGGTGDLIMLQITLSIHSSPTFIRVLQLISYSQWLGVLTSSGYSRNTAGRSTSSSWRRR